MKAEELLPDAVNAMQFGGVTVRKGSVGAFIANARLLAASDATAEARALAQSDLLALVPALRAIGLFEVLEVRDPWLRELVEAG
ncbi:MULTISPECIES: hypothetical protein [unclassified Variovorax]|uniref:hypothetical protein n=1 Tax=unclassified Variovorax TaxID=663243 RepID=UPI001BD5F200|nr:MULTISPECIES: hypothetical protein [unclassified Variovorax]